MNPKHKAIFEAWRDSGYNATYKELAKQFKCSHETISRALYKDHKKPVYRVKDRKLRDTPKSTINFSDSKYW